MAHASLAPTVLAMLRKAGLEQYFRDTPFEGPGYVLGIVDQVELVKALRADPRFYEGDFHLLHPEVGPRRERTEFRSYVKVEGALGTRSLQVVVNVVNGKCYMDTDRHNYQDVVNAVGHLASVVVGVFRRRKKESHV